MSHHKHVCIHRWMAKSHFSYLFCSSTDTAEENVYFAVRLYSRVVVFLTHRVQLSHFDFAFCHTRSQLRRNKGLGGWGFSHPSHSRTFTFSQRFINSQQSAQIFGTICSRWIRAAVCRFRALRFDLKSLMAPLIVLCTAFLLITECAGSPLVERVKFWDTEAAVWTETKWMFHSDCCPESRICHGHCVKFIRSSQLGVLLTLLAVCLSLTYF